jgi:hypothetical protein
MVILDKKHVLPVSTAARACSFETHNESMVKLDKQLETCQDSSARMQFGDLPL